MKFTRALALGSVCLSAVLAVPVSDFDANIAKGLRLIQTSEETAPYWATEDQKLELLRADKGFFDLTETYHEVEEQKAKGIKAIVERATYPSPSKSSTVKSIISTLSTSRMQSSLSTLTSYNNRYYTSSTGSSSSTWIYNQLVSVASGKSGITVSQFSHSWAQKSIIAKFNGASTTAAAVIFGCHIDSINLSSPSTGRAPGADDNGTGTVNLMEVFRALVAAGFSPVRPVEFHFYSAEEVGLLGSQAIAASYKSASKSVYAMINLDMTGYFKPGSAEVIALVTDRVDSGLNTYLRSLISAYCAIPAGTDYCGYACSDHASWNTQGYPAAFPFEAPTVSENPYIHSASDTTSVSGFSWTHSLEFAKLAVAAAVELGSV
ncbi:aminopeptidase [Rhizoctonia solani 123E]|uniref:Peptide hydrolase n=1 Tax=Rhizoctonia solani 123E TaxID=1423351 RepID=A0A074SHS3_9AGAM|nr:aminopeptidase [Rhizoctonia solani 123E]